MAEPTAYERYFFELVNRARLDPEAEAERFGVGLNDGLPGESISATAKTPLAMNPLLVDAARAHGAWMLATDTFSHTGANGSSPGDRMQQAGFALMGNWTWGENIAIRWGGNEALSAQLTEALHEQLFRSAGHRQDLLNGAFRETGIGLNEGEFRGSDGATVTQEFARSGTPSFLLGVAFKDGDQFYDRSCWRPHLLVFGAKSR